MLALGIRFVAGRYHATPWGRHVNEADVEWPPSPWRLLRALIATWHRKLAAQQWSEDALASLIERMAEDAPSYRLPAATRNHVRHYMPKRDGNTTLVFDGFASVDRDEELIVAWPGLSLEAEEFALLDALLENLAYLGRAESWVCARRLMSEIPELNCKPGLENVDLTTGEHTESIALLAPLPRNAYADTRAQCEAETNWSSMKPGARKQLRATLPERLLDALSLDTAELRGAGWSGPPAARFATYQRPRNAFTPSRSAPRSRLRGEAKITTVRLALAGKPLPRIEDALRIGELTRRACIRRAPAEERAALPWALTGHGAPAGNRHGHAYFLPEANKAGRIEHLLIHAAAGFDGVALGAFERLRELYDGRGNLWAVTLEDAGALEAFEHSAYVGHHRSWTSATPYLHPWFAKRGFVAADQLRRECRQRGLPAPEVEPLSAITIRGRPRKALHFHRFRSKHGMRQPDMRGALFRLHFAEAVAGPIALGFAAHFGLGLFHKNAAD